MKPEDKKTIRTPVPPSKEPGRFALPYTEVRKEKDRRGRKRRPGGPRNPNRKRVSVLHRYRRTREEKRALVEYVNSLPRGTKAKYLRAIGVNPVTYQSWRSMFREPSVQVKTKRGPQQTQPAPAQDLRPERDTRADPEESKYVPLW